jgi:hypothetical protein
MLYKGQITVQSHGQNVKQVICMQEPKMVAWWLWNVLCDP